MIISEALFKKLYDTWENDLYIDIKGKPYNIVGVYKYDNIWQSNVYAGYTSVDNAPLISGVEEYNAVTIKLSSSSEREIVGKQAVSVLNGLKPPEFEHLFTVEDETKRFGRRRIIRYDENGIHWCCWNLFNRRWYWCDEYHACICYRAYT